MQATRIARLHLCLVATALSALLAGCCAVDAGQQTTGIVYSHIERTEPRPLQIHVLKIDLADDSLALSVDVAPDPDNDGPAETTLLPPLVHAERGGFIAAVNGNAWKMLPEMPIPDALRYVPDAHCDILGWVVTDGTQRSAPQQGFWSFWVDNEGTPHIGNIATAAEAQWAIAGFGGLLRDGEILPGPSDVRHPRTALGLDRGRRTLVLAVVDGRQPGYSEGMSERELAELMLELGCSDALNLDGGGSSVMVIRQAEGEHSIVNRPSDKRGPRPVPVFFGVRAAP